VALTGAAGTRTYGQLHTRSTRLAHALRAHGVNAGDRVAYLGPNHPAFVETLFATAMLGAVFVPLNTRLAVDEHDYIVNDSGAAVLVLDDGVAEPATAARVVRVADHSPDGYEALLAGADRAPIDEPVSLDDPWVIMYTSGTTGRPKGAVITHGNVTWNVFNVLIDVDVSNREVALVSAPLFHTAALDELFLPTFLKGGTCVLAPGFVPDQTFDLIERHRVSWVFGVPAMFAALAQHPRWTTADLSSLRTVMCGGSPIPPALIRTYQDRGLTFVQGYGMTETAPGALFLRAEQSVAKAGSAGTPCFFTDVAVVDPELKPIAPEERGEVVISGPNVMPGYWRRPDADADAFAVGSGGLAGRWFRSGDAATIDEDGYITIVDRIKDMIISGGENIYPAEVEQLLFEHPAVVECAVIGVPDDRWGEVGRAIVVLTEPLPDPAELLEYLRGRIAGYKIPKSVVVVDALPRGGAGKVLRRDLRASHGTASGSDG
jgi:fatty-acyl-CoA synthase